MLSADDFARNVTGVLEVGMRNLVTGNLTDEAIPITSVELLSGGRVKVTTDEGGDTFSYYIMCSGAEMETPEVAAPIEEPPPTFDPSVDSLEGKEGEETIDEAQPQGVGERIDRKLRPPKVTPVTKNPAEKTPKRSADNDPKQTALGRKAIKKAKRHPQEGLSKFIDSALTSDRKQIAELAAHIDPILEARKIKSAIGTSNDAKLVEIGDIIHNVWSEKFIEKHIGIANSREGELKIFDESAKILDELKEWGAHLCWIERIKKPNYVIYKVCADTTPSKAFMECRNDHSRDLILSGDRANIIPKIFGD